MQAQGFRGQQLHRKSLLHMRVVKVQDFAKHVVRRAFVLALPRAESRCRTLQHASKLQFAMRLLRRSVEPRDVNSFRVFGRDPGQ